MVICAPLLPTQYVTVNSVPVATPHDSEAMSTVWSISIFRGGSTPQQPASSVPLARVRTSSEPLVK